MITTETMYNLQKENRVFQKKKLSIKYQRVIILQNAVYNAKIKYSEMIFEVG